MKRQTVLLIVLAVAVVGLLGALAYRVLFESRDMLDTVISITLRPPRPSARTRGAWCSP